MKVLFLDATNTTTSLIAQRIFADSCESLSAGMRIGESTPKQTYDLLKKHELDCSVHSPVQVTVEAMNDADRIICLSRGCYNAIAKLAPEFLHKTLDAESILCEPVMDPFDMGESAYETCFSQMRRLKNDVGFF